MIASHRSVGAHAGRPQAVGPRRSQGRPGVRDAYHLVDPNTRNGLSIAFFDDGVDVA